MAGRQLSKTLTSLAGEFFVAGQLCARGYVASLTLKNYPGVDVFALNPDNDQQVAVQVKTIRVKGKRVVGVTRSSYAVGDYFIPEHVDDHHERPFVFVVIRDPSNVEFYIVPGTEVALISARERQEYLDWAEQNGRTVGPQPRMLSLEALQSYRDKWENLGL
jgi:hypothetical protein